MMPDIGQLPTPASIRTLWKEGIPSIGALWKEGVLPSFGR